MKYLSSLFILILTLSLASCSSNGGKVSVIVSNPANRQMVYAQEMLQRALDQNIVPDGNWVVELKEESRSPKEGFSISRVDDKITIVGNDGAGLIYGVSDFIEQSVCGIGEGHWTMSHMVSDAPDTELRGCSFDFSDFAYMPEWFYDQEQWISYLDMMAANRMNSLFLPTSFVVVDSTTQDYDKAHLDFLRDEAARRGISVLAMDHDTIIGLRGVSDSIRTTPQRMPCVEPWRWSAPTLINDAVAAMHKDGSGVLNLCQLSSQSDYPLTADKLPKGVRLKQIERDWMWYKAWSRYAWHQATESETEVSYWCRQLAHHYQTTIENAVLMLQALEESGMIAPSLQQSYAITSDNRQTLLLGMMCAQLLSPAKYAEGMDYNAESGQLPTDVAETCVQHALKAIEAIDAVYVRKIEKNKRAEFLRLRNDIYCYRDFAYSFMYKVQACRKVLDYKSSRSLDCLDEALSLLDQSIGWWRGLVTNTRHDYLYANSMQTERRLIPRCGVDGAYNHWSDMLSVYEDEISCLEKNLDNLLARRAVSDSIQQDTITMLRPLRVQMISHHIRGLFKIGSIIILDQPSHYVESIAEELQILTPIVYDCARQQRGNCVIEFENEWPVKLLVGYYRDEQIKYARPAERFTDMVSEGDTCDVEGKLAFESAIHLKGMPLADVYAYRFAAGHHKITLPKGLCIVTGFTADAIKPRNVGLAGDSNSLEWLFY